MINLFLVLHTQIHDRNDLQPYEIECQTVLYSLGTDTLSIMHSRPNQNQVEENECVVKNINQHFK